MVFGRLVRAKFPQYAKAYPPMVVMPVGKVISVMVRLIRGSKSLLLTAVNFSSRSYTSTISLAVPLVLAMPIIFPPTTSSAESMESTGKPAPSRRPAGPSNSAPRSAYSSSEIFSGKRMLFRKNVYLCSPFRGYLGVAQLVAHLVRDQEVARSSRVTQTKKPQERSCGFFLFYNPY